MLEAAISGVHAAAPSAARTDWDRLALLYDALVEVWPAPAVEVARLVVAGRRALRDETGLGEVETRLEALAADGPAYAARDAGLALADLAHRTGRREEAAARYRELVEVVPGGTAAGVLPAPGPLTALVPGRSVAGRPVRRQICRV